MPGNIICLQLEILLHKLNINNKVRFFQCGSDNLYALQNKHFLKKVLVIKVHQNLKNKCCQQIQKYKISFLLNILIVEFQNNNHFKMNLKLRSHKLLNFNPLNNHWQNLIIIKIQFKQVEFLQISVPKLKLNLKINFK